MPSLRLITLILMLFTQSACKTHEPIPETEVLASSTAVEGFLVNDFDNPPPGKFNFCSFNISWLGHWKEKKNVELAKFVRKCDVLAVQELTGTPLPLSFDNGKNLEVDPEAKAFIDAMAAQGFQFFMSPENTGTTTNRINTPAAEFAVVFFKPQRIGIGAMGPKGDVVAEFLSKPLVGNPVFDRVPFAIPMHTKRPNGSRGNDFVLISVHLHAAQKGEAKSQGIARRNKEIMHVMKWAENVQETYGESDFIFLGDMNVEKRSELEALFNSSSNKLGWTSLNLNSVPTNLILNMPYDQVMYPAGRGKHFDEEFKIRVVNLGKKFNLNQYESKQQFVKEYSDHCPIYFQYAFSTDDD